MKLCDGFIKTISMILIAFSVLAMLCMNALPVSAAETSAVLSGSVYEFADDEDYPFSTVENAAAADSTNTMGTFSINGDFDDSGDLNGVPAFYVNSGNISIFYEFDGSIASIEKYSSTSGVYFDYDHSITDVPDNAWSLENDKTKKIDDFEISSNIRSGAIVIQSSLDGETWTTVSTSTDAFSGSDSFTEALYTTKDIQLENGCYYRIIVAYKMIMKTGEHKVVFVSVNDTEEKRCCEVYSFYATNSELSAVTSPDSTPRAVLGSKTSTGKNNGYSGTEAIDKDDPHYGWDLGTFVINGYTRETKSSDDTPVFLKNVGDKVVLWFTLNQNIKCLNGNSQLSIAEDKDGYDRDMEVAQTNFGHGTLLIQYTDYEGVVHDPVIYTDFLAANAAAGADTRVQLFEEGDYVVKLDYEIKNSPREVAGKSVIPTYTDYTITFEFSIRNGNCMVYPFDVETGSELADHAITANGFELDMARSRYLKIDVKKENISVGSNGLLTEDVRFNRPASDGESYTDEGIYIFTVSNQYTGESTTKTIYVGTDKYLTALSVNNMTIDDLNQAIASGASIDANGAITYSEPEPTTTATPAAAAMNTASAEP